MDISSQIDIERRTIRISPEPLALWLRLAGSFTTSPGHAVDYSRLRTISDFEIILQVEGNTWFWIEDAGSIDITPGDVLFIPPGFLHGQAYTAGTHSVVHFDLHARPDLGAFENLHPIGQTVRRRPSSSLPAFAIEHDQAAAPLIIPLVTKVHAPLIWREHLAQLTAINARERPLSVPDQAFVCETLGWMLRTLASDAGQMDISSRTDRDSRVASLLAEVDRKPGGNSAGALTVVEMARRAGMGETAFRQSFQRLTGHPPHAYLEERRIAHAMHLLVATDLAIREIAAASGYEDPYHFSRVYRRVTGCSPREFRRKSFSPKAAVALNTAYTPIDG